MQYKTIVGEILQQQPELYEQLLASHTLLTTMDRYAVELKASHEAWMDRLSQRRPGSNRSQLSSEALEIALWELEHGLRLEFPPDGSNPLTLDEAMAFIRGHGPTA